MGIRGLGGYLKWKVPQARKAIRLPAYKGQRWGVDISCLLYRARGAGLSPLTVMASLFVRLRAAGITPIVIFDGKPPAAKSDVVEQRRNVRVAAHKEMAALQNDISNKSEAERADIETRVAELQRKAPTVSGGEKDEIKQFLYASGTLFVTASGEADDLLAYLCRDGQINAVISTDMDMLARGISMLVVPETPDASVLTEISLDVLLNGLGLTYGRFVDACQLMGSDYTSRSWKGMDPRTAVATAARGVDWSMLDISGGTVMERGAAMLRGDGVVWTALMSEKQRTRWEAGAPVREPEKIAALIAANGWPAAWQMVLG